MVNQTPQHNLAKLTIQSSKSREITTDPYEPPMYDDESTSTPQSSKYA
jgi:hypothetical protein